MHSLYFYFDPVQIVKNLNFDADREVLDAYYEKKFPDETGTEVCFN